VVTCCTVCFSINKIANAVLCDVVHRLYVGNLCFDNVVVLWYMCKYNFVYTRKNSVAFSSPIYVELANSEQRYVQIPYA
jgi:hypothetical protein